ncbi:MAG TPA: hypothetical protein VK066_23455 [Chloroflexota bacterium]|nr:hypothetical protein [Chloroflexota bacterium]
MRWALGLIAVGAAAVLTAFFLGPALALPVALALGAALLALRRSGAFAGGQRLSRGRAAASASLTAGLGVFFARVLVTNPQDNAYLWIALLGGLLVVVAVPFALAAVAPSGPPRGWLARIGVALIWCVGVAGALLLLLGGPLYLASSGAVPGAAPDGRVPAYHLLACLALVLLVWLAGYRWPRQSARTPPG